MSTNERRTRGSDDSAGWRRSLLDRLADVQLAAMASNDDQAAAPFNATASNEARDTILSATPESVFLGLAEGLKKLEVTPGPTPAARDTNPSTRLATDHFDTWDRFDENRQLLGLASSAQQIAARKQRHATWLIVGAGLALCITLGAVGWYCLSGNAPLFAIAEPTRVPRTDPRPPTSPAFAAAIASLKAQTHLSPVNLDATPGATIGTMSFLAQKLTLDVPQDGEILLPLYLRNGGPSAENLHVSVHNLPGGLIPTIGTSTTDGLWRLEIPELPKFSLIVGAAVPDEFDLTLSLARPDGSIVALIGSQIALRRPLVVAQQDHRTEPVRTPKPDVSPPRHPTTVEKAAPKPPARPIATLQPTDEEEGEDKMQPSHQAKPALTPSKSPKIETARKMGVGLTVVPSAAPKVAPPVKSKSLPPHTNGGDWRSDIRDLQMSR